MQRFELKSPDRGRLARPTSQRSLVGGVSDGEPTRLKNPHRIPASTKGKGAMDEFAYFHQMDVPTLIHVALFMTLWVGDIVAIDYWVGARRL